MGEPDASDEDERAGGDRSDAAGSDHRDDDHHPDAGSERDGEDGDRYGEGFAPGEDRETGSADGGDGDYESLREELEDIRDDVAAFESEIEDRTVPREEVEADLRAYVRRRLRRGHARGWGPYLVLLYGTAMTIGAFVELSGVWAVLAMVVIWLSTLGLYVLMVLFGAGIAALSAPGRAMAAVRGLIDALRDVRS